MSVEIEYNDELRQQIRARAEAALLDKRNLEVAPEFIIHILTLTDEIRAELAPLRNQATDLMRERDQALGRASILAAQLAGWEAQCAAQVQAAQLLIDHIEVNHPACLTEDPELPGRLERLKEAISTDAGRFVLAKLRDLEQEVSRQQAGAAALRRALEVADRELETLYGAVADHADAPLWRETPAYRDIHAILDTTEAGAEMLLQLDQLKAQIAGLNLAATQYSESRDRHFLAAKEAAAQSALYRGTISSAANILRARPGRTALDDDVIRALDHTLTEREAGRVLHAELEAAQGLAAYLDAQLSETGMCPVCQARMNVYVGVFEHADGCALEAFEAARKAREQ